MFYKSVPEEMIGIPQILLPAHADVYTWAVNACDQFTGNAKYWKAVEELTAGRLSTYHLVFPEIYLKDCPERRIQAINAQMYRYLSEGVFRQVDGGFVLVERTTASGTRTGIVLAIDLEAYSFRQEEKAPVRSTEATVLDRLPPRVKIREGAPLELPHIMLLYNDPHGKVLSAAQRGEVLYDSDLNMGGGHVSGTYIRNAEEVRRAFLSLRQGADGMLFAVGDGNHSLAAAKLCWEKVKKGLDAGQQAIHPARYALCEAVNIFDPALDFHPIHRFIKISDPEKFFSGWNIRGGGSAGAVVCGKVSRLPFTEDIPAGIRMLDNYIAEYIAQNGGEVDYIHGDDQLLELSQSGAGVMLPAIKKSDFFSLIETGGNLPQKTFSLGEGNEKRYYIEAKRIK